MMKQDGNWIYFNEMVISKRFCGRLFAVLLFLMMGMNAFSLPDSRQENVVDQQGEKKIDVSGVILDDTGVPMPGVNVFIEGTTIGTITDIDGKYALRNIDSNAILVVSFIGFQTQKINVAGTSQHNLKLVSDAELLGEVVVAVGYTSVKRANLLGSVADISAKEVEDVVTGNLSTALQGQMPGVVVGQSSGAPGASTAISIRTSGSFNGETPIFVIDGFIRDQAAFDILDPSEVESISVLKDASAAVYGARSAGGVFLVTTKRGKTGKPKITYSGNVGISDATRTPELMSGYEHAVALNDYTRAIYKWDENKVATNPQGYTYFSDDELEQIKGLNYNWLDEGWKAAVQTRHNINATGGTENARYFVGGSYMFQNGNFDNLSMNKYTMRMGVDLDFSENWTLSLGLSGNQKKTEMPYNDLDKEPEKMYITYATLLRAPRWLPPFINGLPVGQNQMDSHPLYLNDQNSYRKSNSSDMTANMALEWKLPWVKGLKARTSFDYSKSNSGGTVYAKPYYLYNFATVATQYTTGYLPTSDVVGKTEIVNGNKYYKSSNESSSYQWNASLDYKKKIGYHDLSVLAVMEQSESSGSVMSGTATGLKIDNVESSEAFGLTTADDFYGAFSTPSGNLSFVGRLNYSFHDKYLLESTMRYEASTKFAPEDRWGFFPSVSLGWRISEEPFFQNLVNPDVLDNMKFRVSYGMLGNDKQNELSWEENYLYSSGTYLGGGTLLGQLYPANSGIALKGVTWEKSESYNAGVDARFFKHLTVGLDTYYRHTYDILDRQSSVFSYTTGISTAMPKTNYGIQDSWGGEISLGYSGKIRSDWDYDVRGNLGYATSKIIRKFQSPAQIGTWADEEGRIGGGEVGYTCTGILSQADVDAILAANPDYTIFERTPQAGMLNFKDVGGAGYSNTPDGKVGVDDQRIISKYDSPPFNYGFSLGLGWKGIKLDATFSGEFGNDVLYDKAVYTTGEGNRSSLDWLSLSSNNLKMWNDHWTPENTDASMPKLFEGNADQRSTFWMHDGHTLTMRTLTVSYNLPKIVLTRLGIEGMRVYFSGNNLWTIVNPYPYKDAGLSSWMDYPIMRSFNFGLSMNL